MSSKQCRIVGKVVYSAGDGPEQTIPLGPCEIVATSQDATISWKEDGGNSGVASLPIDTYTAYLSDGVIALRQ